LDQAEFVYNINKSVSTNLSPFETMYGFQPLTPVSITLSGSDPSSDKNADTLLQDHSIQFQIVQDALLDTQRRMSNQHDWSQKDISFKIGNLVYLDASDLKKPPGLAHRLLLQFHGPFKVLEHLLPLNYCLDLPPRSHAHDIFHVKKLLPTYECDWYLFLISDNPVPDDDPITNDLGDYYDEKYEVKKLITHWYDSKGDLQYKVKWSGFPKEHNSWQTLEDLTSAPKMIQSYW
jgi:hypothetical protein